MNIVYHASTHTKHQTPNKLLQFINNIVLRRSVSAPCSDCIHTHKKKGSTFYLVSFQPTDRSIMMTSSVKACRLTLFHQSIVWPQRCLPNRLGKLCCHSNSSNRKHDNQQTIQLPEFLCAVHLCKKALACTVHHQRTV